MTPPDTPRPVSTPETGRTAKEIVDRIVAEWVYFHSENERQALWDIAAREITAALTSAQEENAGLRAERDDAVKAARMIEAANHAFERALATARQEEREECAKIADRHFTVIPPDADSTFPTPNLVAKGYGIACIKIANAIRSRSASSPSTPTGTVSGTGGEGWRPIDTAPKDGTRIIIRATMDYTPETLAVRPDLDRNWIDVVRWGVHNTDGDQSWVDDDSDWSCSDPTHWMPLPAPPADERVTDIAEEPGR